MATMLRMATATPFVAIVLPAAPSVVPAIPAMAPKDESDQRNAASLTVVLCSCSGRLAAGSALKCEAMTGDQGQAQAGGEP
eukprot:CAMPEP_0170603248 /NCGR_PEP_ID=MMETSP0224-20130122/18812_1 /TAXON_ID=285029 /ORGANISM="Togula jolla, Strain CCCM 725" /LENGTH=80 /DNA_ID=CAMNT_0010928119 /DNA_START=540 /DNA_END=781 /DNA_ORIENTATION=+